MAELTYLKLFFDQLQALEPLTDEETGRLLRGLWRYAAFKETPTLNGNERFLWPMLKNAQDRAEAAYSEFIKNASEAGKRGGRPKKGTLSKKGYGFSEKGKNPLEDESEEESEEEPPPPTPSKRETPNGGAGSGGAYVILYIKNVNRNELGNWLERLPEEVVNHAADEACAQGKATWKYMSAILERYEREGIRTVEAAKASDGNPRASKPKMEKYLYVKNGVEYEYERPVYDDPPMRRHKWVGED